VIDGRTRLRPVRDPRRAALMGCALSMILFGLSGCAGMASMNSDTAAADQYRRAEGLFEKGRYSEAVTAYHAVTDRYPDDPLAARALYQAAYAQIYYKNPNPDYAAGSKDFEDLVQKYPDSSWKGPAQNWLSFLNQLDLLRGEREKLRNDLQKLVDLDLQSERKRRELK
jgi:outer membrane protein assembly factor BamD (BamD/ComL family)